MSRIRLPLLAALLALTTAAYAAPIAPIEIGAAAPKTDVKVTAIDGSTKTLAELAGEGGLLVIFSCNTCPWVIKWQDRYNELAQMAAENKIGIVILNPNEKAREQGDGMDDMKAHAEKYGYAFTYALDKDHEIADAFGATRTPDVFLFNSEMKLVYRGAIDDNANDKDAVKEPYLKNAIAAVSTGKEVATPTTKSVGCGIKR